MEAHQLPKECYPPTDSDDDSFEVLETDSNVGECRKDEEDLNLEVRSQLLSSDGIDTALDITNDAMLSAMTLQSLPQMPKIQSMHESLISSSSTSSDASKIYIELQEKIKDLREENTILRTTLQQQSLVTKNHSDILTTWKEDVVRVHESHKQKFEKMKALIDQLKKENKQLKQMVAASSEEKTAAPLQVTESAETLKKHEQQLKEMQDKHAKELQDKTDELQLIKTELEEAITKCGVASDNLQKAQDELLKMQEQSMVMVQNTQDQTAGEKESLETRVAKAEEELEMAEKALLDLRIAHVEEIHVLEKKQKQEMSALKKQFTDTQEEKSTAEQDLFKKQMADKEKEVTETLEESNKLKTQLVDMENTLKEGMKKLEEKHQLEVSALQQQLAGNDKQAQAEVQKLLEHNKDELLVVTNELVATKELNEQQALRINDLKSKLSEISKLYDLTVVEMGKVNKEYAECRVVLGERCDEIVDLQEKIELGKKQIIALNAAVEGKKFTEEQFAEYKLYVEENEKQHKSMEAEYREATKKEQDLQEQIMVLKCQLVKLRNEETGEMQRLRIQLSEAQNAIVEWKEAKKIVDKEAADNREAVDELDRRYKAAKCDQDKIVALEEQLKIYQADFKAEREGKVFVIEELNNVSQDLENVQSRNRELIDEIERLRSSQDFVNVSSASQSAPKTNTPSPPPARYPCPMCNEKFRSLRQLEDHVEECINLSN